jgi:hypothetical protein
MDLHAKIAKTTRIATMLVCFGLVHKIYQWRQNASAERNAQREARRANRKANQARLVAIAADLELIKQQLELIVPSNAQKEIPDKAAQ